MYSTILDAASCQCKKEVKWMTCVRGHKRKKELPEDLRLDESTLIHKKRIKEHKLLGEDGWL